MLYRSSFVQFSLLNPLWVQLFMFRLFCVQFSLFNSFCSVHFVQPSLYRGQLFLFNSLCSIFLFDSLFIPLCTNLFVQFSLLNSFSFVKFSLISSFFFICLCSVLSVRNKIGLLSLIIWTLPSLTPSHPACELQIITLSIEYDQRQKRLLSPKRYSKQDSVTSNLCVSQLKGWLQTDSTLGKSVVFFKKVNCSSTVE